MEDFGEISNFPLPNDMLDLIDMGFEIIEEITELIRETPEKDFEEISYELSEIQLVAPIPKPRKNIIGIGLNYTEHVAESARTLDTTGKLPQKPIIFSKPPTTVTGTNTNILMNPKLTQQLDWEVELAVVIGKKGRNIKASEADAYIAGFTIMNDMSARKLQMEEMLLNLGPAKGKDFSTVIGPWLVTPDELSSYLVPAKQGHVGNNYNLSMKCWVNDILVSEGNVKDMDWTFAEIIERCSYGVTTYPGDVIGSGTVGTGCFLELNGTGKRLDPNFQPQWLQNGDRVTMTIDALGTLENKIIAEETNWSILSLKK